MIVKTQFRDRLVDLRRLEWFILSHETMIETSIQIQVIYIAKLFL
jgi:hypothetical protein